jgi:cell fate regulator YaaT (PSP1 superfamily)
MAMVCAVAFERHGRLYYADPGELDPQVGEHVLYPTDDGAEVAQVVWAAEWVSDDPGPLPVLAGRADAAELERAAASRRSAS